MSLRSLYGNIILDHYKNPRNMGELADADVVVEARNPLCGDELTLYLKMGEEGKLAQVNFTGVGCAISQASASMMTEAVKGLPREQAEELIELFRGMVLGERELDAEAEAKLGDLVSLEGVSQLHNRVKCATLAWNALKEGLEEFARGGSRAELVEKAD